MKRRAYLASLGGLLSAGCTGSGSDLDVTTSTQASTTTTTTTETTTTETTTEEPTTWTTHSTNELDIPRDRRFVGEQAITENNIGLKADYWTGKPRVRYYDNSTDSLKYFESSMGWFITYRITIDNLGDSPQPMPDYEEFSLLVAEREYQPLRELPQNIDWGALRQSNSDYKLEEPGIWPNYDKIPGGERAWIIFLFDAPQSDEYYVKWNPMNLKVEGENTPIYLATGD